MPTVTIPVLFACHGQYATGGYGLATGSFSSNELSSAGTCTSFVPGVGKTVLFGSYGGVTGGSWTIIPSPSSLPQESDITPPLIHIAGSVELPEDKIRNWRLVHKELFPGIGAEVIWRANAHGAAQLSVSTTGGSDISPQGITAASVIVGSTATMTISAPNRRLDVDGAPFHEGFPLLDIEVDGVASSVPLALDSEAVDPASVWTLRKYGGGTYAYQQTVEQHSAVVAVPINTPVRFRRRNNYGQVGAWTPFRYNPTVAGTIFEQTDINIFEIDGTSTYVIGASLGPFLTSAFGTPTPTYDGTDTTTTLAKLDFDSYAETLNDNATATIRFRAETGWGCQSFIDQVVTIEPANSADIHHDNHGGVWGVVREGTGIRIKHAERSSATYTNMGLIPSLRRASIFQTGGKENMGDEIYVFGQDRTTGNWGTLVSTDQGETFT